MRTGVYVCLRYYTLRESPRSWRVDLEKPYELQDGILSKVVVDNALPR